MPKSNAEIVKILNEALADEYAQYIEMATQASITSGEQALYLKEFFEQQAAGSLDHAAKLRERIFFLGGRPTVEVGKPNVFDTSAQAITAAIDDHKRLVDRYKKILTSINRTDGDLLYEVIEEILEGEQSDLEAFIRLSGKIPG